MLPFVGNGPYVKGNVYTGSVVKSISNPYVEVITAAQIRSKAGRNADWNNGDFCILVNGDEGANDWHVQTVLNVGNAKVDARVTTYTGGTSVSGAVRIDYLLYMR